MVVLDQILPGYRYDKVLNKLVWSQKAEDADRDLQADQRTFKLLRQIADSIDSDIQFEEDTPSKHESGRLPCLDLQLWIEKDSEGVDQVQWEFYKKPMSSQLLVMERSALSSQTKRATLFSEGMRRVMNCSPQVQWDVKAEHLSKFSHSMMISGYSHRYRSNIINGVVKRYKEIQGQVEAGERGWYRTRQEIQKQKVLKGGLTAATWHLRDDTTQTLFLPITPGSELVKTVAKKIGHLVGPEGGKTKVIEQGGRGLLGTVQPGDPFRSRECRWKETCMVDPKFDCMNTGCIYRITCKLCPGDQGDPRSSGYYLGQSGRTLHARQAEHARGILTSARTCPMVRHAMDKHNSTQLTPEDFTMSKLRRTKDNMTRLLGEGHYIAEAGGPSQGGSQQGALWNSKGEFGKGKLIRWTQQVDSV